MIISSKRKLEIKDVKILPGVRNYPLDHKDPLTAHELYILKFEQKVIFFEEILPMEKKINEEKKKKVSAAIERAQERIDRINAKLKPHVEKEKEQEPDVREPDEGTGRPGRDGNTDSGGGAIPSKKKNASPTRRALPKRRNRKNKTS